MALAACAADVVQDDDPVLLALARLGYASETVVVHDNVIVVGGDQIIYRDALERGEYEVTQVEPQEDVEKGYKYASVVSSAHAASAKLVWATGSWAPDTTMRDAFINAAGDFNSVASCDRTLSQNNPGPSSIKVHSVPEGSWPPAGAPCDPAASGCAEIPSGGKPGAHVWMKRTSFAPGCFNWSASALANRVRHELGHAYGLAHAKESGSTLISGTTACSGSTSSCPNNPTYSTVMKQTLSVVAGPCTGSPTVLQTDDRNSVAVLY